MILAYVVVNATIAALRLPHSCYLRTTNRRCRCCSTVVSEDLWAGTG
ncbi:hypothetical protein ACFY3U_16360 [Micromonospora sp. NPDC000089]